MQADENGKTLRFGIRICNWTWFESSGACDVNRNLAAMGLTAWAYSGTGAEAGPRASSRVVRTRRAGWEGWGLMDNSPQRTDDLLQAANSAVFPANSHLR